MEDLCHPAIKNHDNARFNPLAQYNKPLTYEQNHGIAGRCRSHHGPAMLSPE